MLFSINVKHNLNIKSMIIDKRLNLLNQLIKYFSLKTLIKYFKIKSMRTKSGFFFFFFEKKFSCIDFNELQKSTSIFGR